MRIHARTYRAVTAATFLGLLALAPVAWSQDPPEEPAEPASEEEQEASEPRVDEYVFVEGSLPFVPDSNTVVTKLPLELRFTPNNVGMVTGPVLREQFDRVASDALVNVSNVNIQTQNGIHDFFVIRGFDSLSSGLVLTDGAPEPEATLYQMYNVERVELLKGPGGFLYGSNPLAGTLNLVRKQPLPSSFLDFRATAGSYENFEGGLDWNYANSDGSRAFRVNALARDQGSYRDGKGGSTFAINPSFTWLPDSDTRLNLNFEYVDLSMIPDSGIPIAGNESTGQEPIDVDRETNYQSPLDASDQKIFRLQADFERKLTDNVTLRNKFYYRGLDWQSAGTLLNGVIPAGPESSVVLRTFLDLDDQQIFTGNQLETVVTFETGSLRHSLLGGFELARQADEFLLDIGLLPFVDAFEPVEPPGTAPTPTGVFFEGDARSIIAAPYVIDQIEAGRLRFLLGGRLDTIDFEDPLRERRERISRTATSRASPASCPRAGPKWWRW